MLLTKQERKRQEMLAARLRAQQIAEKQRHVVKAGQLESQWGKVVTNEQRLIDNGHYMKTSEGAALSYAREQYRKKKKEIRGQQWTHVKKRNGVTVEVKNKSEF